MDYIRYNAIKSLEAYHAIKNMPISEVPTDLLYTAFDDSRKLVTHLSTNARTVRDVKLYKSNKMKIEQYGAELRRRGLRVMY